jgi:pimeloyl-ACP methyl ester carboxylesterase
MNRRTACRLLGAAAAAAGCRVPAAVPLAAQSNRGPSFTVYGNASSPALVCANGGSTTLTAESVAPLAARYRVIVMEPDEPPALPAEESTADRVCARILASATAAGVDRFAWYGYSFGAVVGLQLATRTSRLTALICGGWPPLDGPYRAALAVTEARAARGEPSHGRTFYRSIRDWPEREAITRLTVPRMAFAGSDDQFVAEGNPVRIGATLAAHQDELQRLGWRIDLVGGFGHDLGARLDVVIPLVLGFLDTVVRK